MVMARRPRSGVFTVTSHAREEMVDITERVAGCVREAGIGDGVCTVFVPHTTAAVTINENADPAVAHDMLSALAALVPRDRGYTHAEGNSDAHLKASLIGNSTAVLVEDGRLMLGVWQAVYLCEFDGPRHREVWVRVARS
jgi:secondary thiamine-phosphate synthase enzyme